MEFSNKNENVQELIQERGAEKIEGKRKGTKKEREGKGEREEEEKAKTKQRNGKAMPLCYPPPFPHAGSLYD